MPVSLRLPDDGIPSLLPTADFNSKELSAEDGFLLSRIDGGTNLKNLRALTGWSGDRTDESIAKLMYLRMIQVRLKDGEIIELSPRAISELRLKLAKAKGVTAGVTLGGIPEPEAYMLPPDVDRGLLSLEVATHVMRAIEKGELGYWYEVLGLSPRADARKIKQTYHAIASEIHPDNFYGRNLGVWTDRINQAFDYITRAYDILSDAGARAAHDHELEERHAPEAPDAVPAEQATGNGSAGKPKGPAGIVDQIRMKVAKARELAKLAESQMNQGHWQEAYNSLQMAAQFDPYNPDYKKQADFLKPKLNVKKAKQMFEEALQLAHAGQGMRAIKLLEEVINIDPARPAHRYEYARLLFQERQKASALDGDFLEMAKDHVEAALIMEPENAKYLTLAGQVFRAKGENKAAADFLKRALKRDKNNAIAKQELEEIG